MSQMLKPSSKFTKLKDLSEKLKNVHPTRGWWSEIEPLIEQIKSFVGSQFLGSREDILSVEKPQIVTSDQILEGERHFIPLDNERISQYVNNIIAKVDAILLGEDIVDTLAIPQNNVSIIIEICSRFDSVAHVLKTRIQGKDRIKRAPLLIKNEYDVQYVLMALLKPFFDDIRPEEYTPSRVGSSSRMDILLKNEKIVIELKMTRKGLGNKEIKEQFANDLEDYMGHRDCDTLIYFVYDPAGTIKNQLGLVSDLSGSRRLKNDHINKESSVVAIVSPERK